MKNFCYNKDTKMKERNKKCFKLSIIYGEKANEQVKLGRQGSAKGRRDTAKEKKYQEGTKSDDSCLFRGESLRKERIKYS